MSLRLGLGGSGSSVPAGGTTGQVLKKNSNTDGDSGWGDTAALSNATPLGSGDAAAGTSPDAARADHVHPARWPVKMRTGFAYAPGASGNTSPGNGVLAVAARLIAQAVTLSQLVIRATTVNASGVIRIGIWDDSSGLPGALRYDSGDLSTAANNITHSPAGGLVLPAGLVWVGIVPQNANLAAFRALAASDDPASTMVKMNAGFDPNVGVLHPTATGIAAGALPNPFPVASLGFYTVQVAAAQIWFAV